VFYLETSAAAKLVLAEQGSTALRRWLEPRADGVFSSDLLRTELVRLVRRGAPEQLPRARSVLESIVLLALTTEICERAAVLGPDHLRNLDALHLAAATQDRSMLRGIVTYDDRLADAAAAIAVPVIAPH
jgi:predicted nucleic acid-binding protein